MSTLNKGFLEQLARDTHAAWRKVPTGPYSLALVKLVAAISEVVPLIPEPKQIDLDRELVARLLKIEDGLSEWEVKFIESLSRWVENQPLTPAQRDRAQQIER